MGIAQKAAHFIDRLGAGIVEFRSLHSRASDAAFGRGLVVADRVGGKEFFAIAPLYCMAARGAQPFSGQRGAVRTCSGRTPMPRNRAGSPRKKGYRCSSFKNSGIFIGAPLNNRVRTRFWTKT